MNKINCIGIIAEDDSDFESAKILIKRILNRENLTFKKAIGNGCGKLRRKALQYSIDLRNRGCDTLILIHDLDRNIYDSLLAELSSKLKDSPISKRHICIPIEEIEAWFLSDPLSIKEIFQLSRKPKFDGMPETIKSPKEILEKQIWLCSGKQPIYLNTKHNPKLASKVSLDLIKSKCKSFEKLHDFLTKNR